MSKPSIQLRCTGCGRLYPLDVRRCSCNGGILRAIWPSDRSKVSSLPVTDMPGIWRYEKALPPVSPKLSFWEGRTPLVRSARLGDELNIVLSFKDETRNPTGSFKDRAAAVMLSAAKDMGVRRITTASSGNAAGAIALYSMLAGINAFIFMFQPSEGKLVQTLSYGATVLIVDTPNEARVLELAEEAADTFGWSLLNTTAAANPFVVEGYKTISYELYEQGLIADWIAIPVASGSMLIGIWQGFCELREAGLLQELPRLLGVQPANAAPIALAFATQEKTVRPIKQANTIATALSLEDPGVSGIETLRAVRENDGVMLTIEDNELIDVARNLPRQDGIFGEASGVISVAGVIRARETSIIRDKERVICIISGGGLKDPCVFLQEGYGTAEPLSVPDNIGGVASILKREGIPTQ